MARIIWGVWRNRLFVLCSTFGQILEQNSHTTVKWVVLLDLDSLQKVEFNTNFSELSFVRATCDMSYLEGNAIFPVEIVLK